MEFSINPKPMEIETAKSKNTFTSTSKVPDNAAP